MNNLHIKKKMFNIEHKMEATELTINKNLNTYLHCTCLYFI